MGGATAHGTAAQRWAEDLQAWAVPEELVAAAGRDPWVHPVQRFAARADAGLAEPGGASYVRARTVLEDVLERTEEPGTVLDVGAGAGAASLPLGPWAAEVVAVYRSADMLAAFAERAERLGLPYRTVEGSWPEVAGEAGPADLVVCHHVVYDVADITPFLDALTGAARERVVLEVPPLHPLTWMNPLWERFHGMRRPERPSSDDLVAVLHDLGVRALAVDRWVQAEAETLSHQERVALVTRRLCLPETREAEVAEALEQDPPPSLRQVVTMSWAGSAQDRT
jgi:SAM-dependent methyltransferase